jgi:hypothetical protein
VDLHNLFERANYVAKLYNKKYNYFASRNYHINHTTIRNYKNMISCNDYIKPELIEYHYLETGECIAIIKTFWIKIIQRTWKNILKKKQEIINKRMKFTSIFHREQRGKWAKDCLILPGLKGMLCNTV